MDKVEFEKLYAELQETNPEIPLRTGINALKCNLDPKQFKQLTGYKPDMVFKYEISNGYTIYVSFGCDKNADANSDGTISLNGFNFIAMRGTNLMHQKFGIVGNLINCGAYPCIKPDPFATSYCEYHSPRLVASDIVKYAKEFIQFREIPKDRIVLIERVVPDTAVIPQKYSIEDIINHPNKKTLFKDLLSTKSTINNLINERDKLLAEIILLRDTLLDMKSKQNSHFDYLIKVTEARISDLNGQALKLDERIANLNHRIDDNTMVILGVTLLPLLTKEKEDAVKKHENVIKNFHAETEVQIENIRKARQVTEAQILSEQKNEISAIDALISEIEKLH